MLSWFNGKAGYVEHHQRGVDLEEIREKAKQVSQKPINKNFCVGGEDTALLSEQSEQDSEEESKVLIAKTRIPNWVRDTAQWWAEGAIGDSDFVSGIQYLINPYFVTIPTCLAWP